MAPKAPSKSGLNYPSLTRDEIDAAITALLAYTKEHTEGQRNPVFQGTAKRLISYYMSRWGLPSSLAHTAAPEKR